MSCRVADLCEKEVVCLKDGTKLGNVCDVEVDTETGKLLAIVIYGRLKCFGIFGREEDCVVNWCDIEIIGADAILVNCEPIRPRGHRKGRFLDGLFGPKV